MKGHNQQVNQRVGSTKKVQFKDEAHETELGGSEIDDGNVGPTPDIPVLF
jgi:U3 small nucleolar RNA-associated protein MPP10